MANFNLRGAIMQNVAGSSEQDVETTITDAVQSGEEKMLPGLGVLMEVFWKEATEEEKQKLVQKISDGLQ